MFLYLAHRRQSGISDVVALWEGGNPIFETHCAAIRGSAKEIEALLTARLDVMKAFYQQTESPVRERKERQ